MISSVARVAGKEVTGKEVTGKEVTKKAVPQEIKKVANVVTSSQTAVAAPAKLAANKTGLQIRPWMVIVIPTVARPGSKEHPLTSVLARLYTELPSGGHHTPLLSFPTF